MHHYLSTIKNHGASIFLSMAYLLFTTRVSSQNVGIGTLSPHTSALLEVSAGNKGILIPRVSLSAADDINAVSTPAHGLMLYNVNPFMDKGLGVGYYYNTGDEMNPFWKKLINNDDILITTIQISDGVVTSEKLSFPLIKVMSYNGAMISMTNTGGSNSVGVFGQSDNGAGIKGISSLGKGLYGYSNNGVGVMGESVDSTGVEGKSVSQFGIRGFSLNSTGVYGISQNAIGMQGKSANSTGVDGQSITGTGISGKSVSGIGVSGTSASFYGVYGKSTNHTAVYGIHSDGIGSSGQFINTNDLNSANTLETFTNGTGWAFNATSNNNSPLGILVQTTANKAGIALSVANGGLQFSADGDYTSGKEIDDADLVVQNPGSITLPTTAADGQHVWVINRTGGNVTVTNTTVGSLIISGGMAKGFIFRKFLSPNNWFPVD